MFSSALGATTLIRKRNIYYSLSIYGVMKFRRVGERVRKRDKEERKEWKIEKKREGNARSKDETEQGEDREDGEERRK